MDALIDAMGIGPVFAGFVITIVCVIVATYRFVKLADEIHAANKSVKDFNQGMTDNFTRVHKRLDKFNKENHEEHEKFWNKIEKLNDALLIMRGELNTLMKKESTND